METADALATLRAALHDAVQRSPFSAREVSRRLGRHPGYLGRVLNGRLELKVRETAELLALLGIEAEEFLEAVYPLGGGDAEVARRRRAAQDERVAGTSTREVARMLDRRSPLAPAELTAKARRLLRRMIRAGGTTQRALSLRLGLSRDALGQALRGSTQLSFRHLFGCLEGLGVEPGRFFAEIAGPDDRDVVASLRWRRRLDLAERFAVAEAGVPLPER